MQVGLAHDVVMRDATTGGKEIVSTEPIKHDRRGLHVRCLEGGSPDLAYRFGGLTGVTTEF
jgi:hypothetical protein